MIQSIHYTRAAARRVQKAGDLSVGAVNGIEADHSHMRGGSIFLIVWSNGQEIRIDRFSVPAFCSIEHGLQGCEALSISLKRVQLSGAGISLGNVLGDAA